MLGLPISRPAFDDTQEPWENYTSGGEEMRRRLQNKYKGIGLLDLGPNGTYTHRRITKISWFEGKLTGKTGGRSPAQCEAMAKPMKDSSQTGARDGNDFTEFPCDHGRLWAAHERGA